MTIYLGVKKCLEPVSVENVSAEVVKGPDIYQKLFPRRKPGTAKGWQANDII